MIVIKKIKVLEAISDTNIGGAGRLLISRIKNSDKKRFNYFVILPKGSLLAPLLKGVGANIIELNACKDESFDFRSIFKVYKIIKRIKPDILNAHACITARIAGRFAGVRVNLYTRHCDFPIKKIYSIPTIRNAMKKFNSIFNDGVIAVSQSAKMNLLMLGMPEKKIKVIINGAQALTSIDFSQKRKIKAGLKIPADAIVVSIFARLEEYKDHKTFLRAVEALNKYNDKIYFLIVGSGSLDKELKNYAKKLGVEKQVLFLGFIDDISNIMNITDINVNCSIGTETSSLALSEGMSLGVPAIASDYPGNKYIVKNKVNGLIFTQKDYKGLASRILLLSRDKALYNQLSKNAKIRFNEELNAKRMTQETEKYYLSMLNKNDFKNCEHL